jgi:protein TonB
MIKIGKQESSGANLRLVSAIRREKKVRHRLSAGLEPGQKPNPAATREMLDRYFEGPDKEEKKPAQYSLLVSLVTLLVAFYIVFPVGIELIDLQKKQEEVYIPAGGYSAPPRPRKQEQRVEVKEEQIPQLYPEVEDLNMLVDEPEQENLSEDWENLEVYGDIESVDFGLGGSGGGPILNAGAGGDVPEPELIYRVEPEYPDAARRSRVDGFVLLQAIINKKGDVVDIKVLQTPPERYGFAEKAKEAVAQWKFKPAIYKGKPVSVRIRFSVEFNLVY